MGLLVALAPPFSRGEAHAQTRRFVRAPQILHDVYFGGWAASTYALDPVPRYVEKRRRWLKCDKSQITTYRSSKLDYKVPVHRAFIPRIRKFEKLAIELAKEHFGRAPKKLRHKGAYVCRQSRGRTGRISEHALGNALDVKGFDFGSLRDGERTPRGLSRRFKRSFRVRVYRHWNPSGEREEPQAAFLHDLTEKLRKSPEIFRGIVGPPHHRHTDHLHLDAAPWRYTMFGYDPVGPSDH